MSIQQSQEPARKEDSGLRELTADEMYDILSNQRRRFVLWYLRTVAETSLRDLSRLVAAWENGIDPDAVTATQRKRVYTALHQTHLVRLDEYSIVEYDRNRGTVVPTSRLAAFDPYLRDESAGGRPWHRYYSAVGLGGALLVAANIGGIPVVASIDGAVLAFVLSGTVLGMAIAQALTAAGEGVTNTLPGLRPTGPVGEEA